jgi:hypothetical protein|tara:strand:- start:70 stop:378 length:309 start_codon:yes stop_codon:yes gene_type:complete
MNNNIKRELLKRGDIKFTVKGITELGEFNEEKNTFERIPKVFRVSKSGDSIHHDRIFGDGMNVNKWGPTCVTLYTYDMLGKKTVGKINYSNVKILEVKEEGN